MVGFLSVTKPKKLFSKVKIEKKIQSRNFDYKLYLSDGVGGVGGAVLAVHVVRARSRIVTEPDAEVLDNGGRLLGDLLDRDNLAGGLVHLLVVGDKVPEAGLVTGVIFCYFQK